MHVGMYNTKALCLRLAVLRGVGNWARYDQIVADVRAVNPKKAERIETFFRSNSYMPGMDAIKALDAEFDAEFDAAASADVAAGSA